MTRLAQFFLVLTSLAPIALVEAAVQVGAGGLRLGLAYLLGAVLLALVCAGLLAGVRKWNAPAVLELASPSLKESEPLGFFIAYALPLLGGSHAGNWLGLATFACLLGLLVWQQQLFHMNPLLALFGFHFFSAKNDRSGSVLVIARQKTLAAGRASVIELSDYLWLHLGTLPAGDDGPVRRDSTGQIDSATEA